MTRRLYSVIDADGYVAMHWRTTEADALHYAQLNHLTAAGNTLVGPTGLIVARYGRMTGAAAANPADLAALMLASIDADVAELGWSPVTCFADLHEFTDANDYVTEALDALGHTLGGADGVTDAEFAVLNLATALVDARLVARAAMGL